MRLILGTIGIGLAVAVLLLFASVGHIMADRNARIYANIPSYTVISGVRPTQVVQIQLSYQGETINGAYLHATGPNSPVPPGVGQIPGPNEVVVSPALADLLNSDAGANLRPRFPEKIVGTVAETGLVGPADLAFYAGTGPLPTTGAATSGARTVYAFGQSPGQHSTNPSLLVLAIIGAVALLIPIFIFVSVSSRIAGAERDRRLAALRLVGAGNWQVRRIAAAESLVSAGAGLVLGALAFLGVRQLAPQVDLLGWSTFTSDVVPPLPLTVLIVLLVPVLSVGTVLFAMRRTIIEPLGVVRGGTPVRRRVWWRLALIVVGVGLLVLDKPSSDGSSTWIVLMACGASALLIGVPAIMPWLLERITSRVHGGAPSWQLAIRRLQLDSGTPARVVGGVAVVLTGAIAVQLLLFAAANRYNVPSTSAASNQSGWVVVNTNAAAADQVVADLAKVPAAKRVDLMEGITATRPTGQGNANEFLDITIQSCASIVHFRALNCVDGDGFLVSYPGNPETPTPGQVWNLTGAHDWSSTPKTLGTYTVPKNLIPLQVEQRTGSDPNIGLGVLLTPGAAAKLNLPADRYAQAWVLTDPKQLGATDEIANSVANLTWQVGVNSVSTGNVLNTDQKTFVTIRGMLLAGSLFTLLLAGVSMLVLALEQVRERRRPLAMLAAAGVPRSALARSLLWQTAVPVVLAVLVAVGTGIGLAALVVRMAGMSLRIDWSTIGIFAGAALLLVFLVTALSLPALRSAMRLSALRTE